jgi:hypothetical protein
LIENKTWHIAPFTAAAFSPPKAVRCEPPFPIFPRITRKNPLHSQNVHIIVLYYIGMKIRLSSRNILFTSCARPLAAVRVAIFANLKGVGNSPVCP